MHPGKLSGHTAAARVYHCLRSEPGRWWGGDELSAAAGTTCVSTRISEVRHQLPAGEELEHRAEVFQFQRRQFYRITIGGGGTTEPGASPATLPATAEAGGNLKSSTPAPSLFKELPPRHDWRK